MNYTRSVALALLFLACICQVKLEKVNTIKFSDQVKTLNETNYEETLASGKYFVLYYQNADIVTTNYINAIENYLRKNAGTSSDIQFAHIQLKRKTQKIFNRDVPRALPALYYSHHGYLINTHDSKISDKKISDFIESQKKRKIVTAVDGLQTDTSQFVIYFYSESEATANQLGGLKIAHEDVGVFKVKSRASILNMLAIFKVDTAPLADKDVIFGLRTSDNSVFCFQQRHQDSERP
jgi:hypothetical protein